MSGQKGLAVAIVALLLAISAGYFLNVNQVTETGLEYTKITDLDGILATESQPSYDYEQYTGPYNVTAWTPASMIPTSSVSNAYLITPTVEDYTETTVVWKESDHALTTGRSNRSSLLGLTWETTKDRVYLTQYGQMSDGSRIYGGLGGQDQDGLIIDVLTYNVLDAVQPSDWSAVAVPISDIVGDTDKVDGLRVTVNASWWAGSGLSSKVLYDPVFSIEHDDTGRYDRMVPTWSGEAHALSASYTWSGPLQKWLDSDGVSAYDITFIRVDSTGYTARDLTATVGVPIITQATYADPTGLIDVTEETVAATWSSVTKNPTLVTGSVSMLLRLNWAGDRIYIDVDDTRAMVDYDGDGADARAWMTVDDVEVPLGKLGAYRGYILTFDGVRGALLVRGILAYENAMSYEVGPTVGSTEWPIGAIGSVTVSADSGGAGVRIVDSYIQTDPQGLMWHSPEIDLAAYLPAQADAMRVVMSGWVAVGDAVRIGGTSYPVDDSMVVVTYLDGETVKTKRFPVSGLVVDWYGGHLSIGRNGDTVDLGPTSDHTIGLVGTWYGSVQANSIETVEKTGYELANAWDMTSNQLVLIYLMGIMGGTALCMAVRRDTWGLTDWTVVIVSGAIGLILLGVD